MSNPTTGEWTVIAPEDYAPNSGDRCFIDMTGQLPSRERVYMRPINAALTAEREKRTELNNEWQSLDTDRVKEIQQLHRQLAATERKYLDMERQHRESERQLAAEREKFTEAADYNERLSKVCDNLRIEAQQNWRLIQQLRDQLAAAQAWIKEARHYHKDWPDDLRNDAIGSTAALDAAIIAARKDAAEKTERACEQRQANAIAAAQATIKTKNLALAHLIGCLVASGFQIHESDRDALLLNSDTTALDAAKTEAYEQGRNETGE